jgi:transcriptional regulator with XRE-family HTH domain
MTPTQCRLARTLLRWSIRRLAKETGLVTNTILNFETGHSVRQSTVDTIRNVFAANGVQIKPNGDVRMRKSA